MSSSESHSISNSSPDSSDSSSEEARTVTPADGTTAGQAMIESLRRKRAAGQVIHLI